MNSCQGAGEIFDFLREDSRLSLRISKVLAPFNYIAHDRPTSKSHNILEGLWEKEQHQNFNKQTKKMQA